MVKKQTHVKEGCAGVTHSDAAPREPGRKGGPCRASATPPQRARPSCDPHPARHARWFLRKGRAARRSRQRKNGCSHGRASAAETRGQRSRDLASHALRGGRCSRAPAEPRDELLSRMGARPSRPLASPGRRRSSRGCGGSQSRACPASWRSELMEASPTGQTSSSSSRARPLPPPGPPAPAARDPA